MLTSMRALMMAMLLLPACDDAAPQVEPPTTAPAVVAQGPGAALTPLGGAVPTLARTLSPVPDAPSLVVTLSEVRFGDRKLASLGTDGRIDAASLQGHLVGPVFDALAERADRDKTDHGSEWNDTLVVIADAHVRVDVIADL